MQAELRTKTEGSHILSHPAAASTNTSSAVQRAVMNRHNQTRRSTSGSGATPLRPQQLTQPPRSHSITSHAPSPLGTSKPVEFNGFPRANITDNNQRQQHPIQPRTHTQQDLGHPNMSRPAIMHPMTPTSTDGRGVRPPNPGGQPSYYPSGYQAHLEQLGKFCLVNKLLLTNFVQSRNTMRMPTCSRMKILVIRRPVLGLVDQVVIH